MISVWFSPNSHSSCLFSLPGAPTGSSTYPLSPPPISSSFTLHSGLAVRTTLTLASPSQELLWTHKTDGKAESGRKTRSAWWTFTTTRPAERWVKVQNYLRVVETRKGERKRKPQSPQGPAAGQEIMPWSHTVSNCQPLLNDCLISFEFLYPSSHLSQIISSSWYQRCRLQHRNALVTPELGVQRCVGGGGGSFPRKSG